MSLIFGTTPVSELILAFTLNAIDDCLVIANKYDGVAFGGYVRDVILPRSEIPNCPVAFKDVDLWFKTRCSANRFVNHIRVKYDFIEKSEHNAEAGKNGYTFGRTHYHLTHKREPSLKIAWFDIVVSEVFPVNDFDVNCLVYSASENIKSIRSGNAEVSYDKIVEAIHKREMTMLPTYIEKIHDPVSCSILINRINNRYTLNTYYDPIRSAHFTHPVLKPWTIICNEYILRIPVTKEQIFTASRPKTSDIPDSTSICDITDSTSNCHITESLCGYFDSVKDIDTAITKRDKYFYECLKYYIVHDEQFAINLMKSNGEDLINLLKPKLRPNDHPK